MLEVDNETGYYCVRLARAAAERWIKENKRIEPIKPIPQQAKEVFGAFVTVKKLIHGHEELRGCIGYPIGIKALYEEIIDLAREATLFDPRFPPVIEEELPQLIFEVTILTPPQKIGYNNPEELLDQIEVGRDGLIVRYGKFQGLLLPQVPVEQGWDKETFISYTCRKAWLSPDMWKKEKITVEKFQGVIFAEVSPAGEIKRIIIN